MKRFFYVRTLLTSSRKSDLQELISIRSINFNRAISPLELYLTVKSIISVSGSLGLRIFYRILRFLSGIILRDPLLLILRI